MKKNNTNGDYGKFIIRNRKKASVYYPYEVVARNFQTVTATVEEAINYLIGRFGHDVVYEVKVER